MPKIGIAMSGGGNRAALFNLGVLLYLADAGKAKEIVSISSVSGGSLTNGYVAQLGTFGESSGKKFRDDMTPFIRRIATQGTIWGWYGTWLYIVALIVAIPSLFAIWYAPWPWHAQVGVFVFSLLLWTKVGLGARGIVCGRALATTLFSPHGPPTILKDTGNQGIDHVFCATELHAGEHVYFSGEFVCSYRFGWGEPANLPLHVAVQASSAFPGAFPPRVLRTDRHKLTDYKHSASRMLLLDGGIYDNMADQWLLGMHQRKQRWPDQDKKLTELDEIIVVNSSANLPWSSVGSLQIPLLGELLSLFRVISILYDNTTTSRRASMVSAFNRGLRNGSTPRGVLLTIEQSPYTIADAFQPGTNGGSEFPDRAERAKAVLSCLQTTRSVDWDNLVRKNKTVKTTLRSLGADVSADLLYHAYVSAMTGLHVILDYPLLDVPDRANFMKLVVKD